MIPDTEGLSAEEQQQITPHEEWVWNAEFHWKHWHGIWVNWQPLLSREVKKTYRTVRSLRSENEEKSKVYHKNQWYGSGGSGEEVNWEYGPWIMEEKSHSLNDGILHPNKDDFRILMFPNGDLGWLQLSLKPLDPNCVVFGEVHFMLPSKDGRVAIIIGYDKEGELGLAQMLEEVRESDEKCEIGWNGDVWRHEDGVVDVGIGGEREEPVGEFIGEEMMLDTKLMMRKRKGKWNGFKGGVKENEGNEEYVLVHLGYNFTVYVMKKAGVGKEHSFVVHWIVSSNQVRMMSWTYHSNGHLLNIKSGTYFRQIH